MADGPPTKRAKASSDRPLCPYGTKCYRKNPQHFEEYDHPPKDQGMKDGNPPHTVTGTGASTSSKGMSVDTSQLPPCKYGANCYRKNLLHFAEFSHPTKSGKSSDGDEGSGDDTDVCDSDDNNKQSAKDNSTVDVLNRGASLIKSYSQMTESERRDLIHKAFEAKKKLEEELKETKQKMEEKEKELQKLQAEVNTGLLLMEGEKEALEGKTTVYFPLIAERDYKEGSASQVHFRLAESQFYRLLSGGYGSSYQVTKVEYVVNPKLTKLFKQARADLKQHRGEKLSYPVLAFHGTKTENIKPICETGFRVPGDSGFKHRTDTGWYGKGVYFSEYPGYSMGYIQGATKLFLCQVLPGKVYNCTKLIHGQPLKSGYDSHTSPDNKELVIFNAHHILPCYVVHYKSANTEFKYQKRISDSTQIDDDSRKRLYEQACSAPVAKGALFAGLQFQFSGKLCDTQSKLKALVEKHHSDPCYGSGFNILVCSLDEFTNKSTKVKKATNWGIPMVREEYVYDSILKKTKLSTDDYEHSD